MQVPGGNEVQYVHHSSQRQHFLIVCTSQRNASTIRSAPERLDNAMECISVSYSRSISDPVRTRSMPCQVIICSVLCPQLPHPNGKEFCPSVVVCCRSSVLLCPQSQITNLIFIFTNEELSQSRQNFFQYANHSRSVSGSQKNSSSICSNSRVRNVKLPGVISLRKDLPIWPIPNGIFLRDVLCTFLKLTKIPCAVSGLK